MSNKKQNVAKDRTDQYRWKTRALDTHHRDINASRFAYANRIEVTDYMTRRVEDKDWIISLDALDNAYVQPAELHPTVIGGSFSLGHYGSHSRFGIMTFGLHESPGSFVSETVEGFHYALPVELKQIATAIKEAQALLRLEEDWDMNGALPVEKKTWEAAMNLLVNYSNYLFLNYNLIIPAPQVDPCPNGSVDLFWKEKKAQLLINSKPGTNKASFYGDLLDGEDAIKGKIPSQGVKEYLAVWMKSLAS
jgi:hypothetical protein